MDEIPNLRFKGLNFDALALINLAGYGEEYNIVTSRQVLRNQIGRPEESI